MPRIRKSLVIVSALTAVVAASGPARAASSWSVTNGAAAAKGTFDVRRAPNGTYFDVSGNISVDRNDGHCYYVRFYVPNDIAGRGSNTAQQCGSGVLPVKSSIYGGALHFRGLIYGLCRATPATPPESPLASLGSHCVQI